jgi:hypothetical protein
LTRRDRITILLDWYLDVIHGLSDYELSSEHTRQPILGMCRAWNSGSYRQLERLRKQLRDQQPFTYWHLAERYIRPSFRQVLRCPGCQLEVGTWKQNDPNWGGIHTHKRKTYRFMPALTKVVSQTVDPIRVEDGITWIDQHWRGTAPLPEDLLAVQERRDPKNRTAA